ncbi:ShlB/FhaC/HecB family hemolysin secretion/activation protein [Duganella violaceipulchra]|uniref:Hemolysin activation/secretion protein n=1 Tax=Duganella violaceipulchra TaxID=2849652 RepID=A0AA41H9Y4_9BURK|nr:ShlB/FhaC/HecB family hemolysin secretion/activation protein [Duganella violaceicalia]MBV6323475.1 ShlB/FhaC/HecB family hemolysin secretion/activation protein [Duganella violaceicalia]MCP2007570.1 hemolysin activation/secretion protein [Duganella violaceicalia]
MQQKSSRLRGAVLLCSLVHYGAYGQSQAEIAAQQIQRQQQKERAQNEQAEEQRPAVRLSREPVQAAAGYPLNETPCLPIRHVALQGDQAARFAWALDAAADAAGLCLGSGGVNAVIGKVQNALIAAGYVTTRVLAAPQDLRGGELQLVLVPGRIRAIRYAAPAAGASNDRASWRTALPARPGDLLNLRDIEQALENLKRVPTAEADIEIVPGEQPGESDLLIKWRQALPVRLSLSADDSGSDSTGKYQGGATLSLDNLLGWQELAYVSVTRDLSGVGAGRAHGTRNYALHYSMPAGYWLFSLNASRYRYYQGIAGANQTYVYSGTSGNLEFKAARVLYRDAARKTTAALRLYRRRSNNFIDDTEVQVQRRQMGGHELGLSHKEFLGDATLDANLLYKRGSHLFGTLPAPEEQFDDGTARPTIVNADATLTLPFALRSVKLQYQANWRAQWNRSTLIPQDRFAIGGRYTVRGFDGEASLSAERGWLLRNDLGWSINERTQLYLGLDYGQVAGPHAAALAGTSLAGGALGWRGQFGGAQIDLFIGRPIRKPEHFRTAPSAGGFNVNYQY